jgi:hypothetical protein
MIISVWVCHQSSLISELKTKARYGSYTMMELELNAVTDIELV